MGNFDNSEGIVKLQCNDPILQFVHPGTQSTTSSVKSINCLQFDSKNKEQEIVTITVSQAVKFKNSLLNLIETHYRRTISNRAIARAARLFLLNSPVCQKNFQFRGHSGFYFGMGLASTSSHNCKKGFFYPEVFDIL